MFYFYFLLYTLPYCSGFAHKLKTILINMLKMDIYCIKMNV